MHTCMRTHACLPACIHTYKQAQHVFPMSMLRLAEHEWDTIVSEATNAAGRQPHSFDADQ